MLKPTKPNLINGQNQENLNTLKVNTQESIELEKVEVSLEELKIQQSKILENTEETRELVILFIRMVLELKKKRKQIEIKTMPMQIYKPIQEKSLSAKILMDIMKFSEIYWPYSYRGSRLRIGLMLIAILGLGISQLLSIKVEQAKALIKSNSDFKDSLTSNGIILIENRKKDFKILTDLKQSSDYLFTAENSSKPLEREVMTRIINSFLKKACQNYNNKQKSEREFIFLTSQPFKSVFLNELWDWQDIETIEYVRKKLRIF